MYMFRVSTSHLQAMYKELRKLKRYNIFVHNLMMACGKPKRVHVAGFMLQKYKLCLIDVKVGCSILVFTKQRDKLH
jgi:hypothetical protein